MSTGASTVRALSTGACSSSAKTSVHNTLTPSTEPPFSQNYDKATLAHTERFRYGYTPEGGKKADLMFLQHMLAVLKPDGIVATVMPHGVLFRGGAEGEIRRRIIEDDLLDTVIGLGPNLFCGTGIPAAVLILRAKGSKPPGIVSGGASAGPSGLNAPYTCATDSMRDSMRRTISDARSWSRVASRQAATSRVSDSSISRRYSAVAAIRRVRSMWARSVTTSSGLSDLRTMVGDARSGSSCHGGPSSSIASAQSP